MRQAYDAADVDGDQALQREELETVLTSLSPDAAVWKEWKGDVQCLRALDRVHSRNFRHGRARASSTSSSSSSSFAEHVGG
jgi:hypothetical protein